MYNEHLPAIGPPPRAPIAHDINKYPKAFVNTSMSLPSTVISTYKKKMVITNTKRALHVTIKSVADPGFPIGVGGTGPLGGHQPLMQALFGRNVCKNERIGSHWGRGAHRRSPLNLPVVD